VGFFYFNFFKRNVETKNVCPIAHNELNLEWLVMGKGEPIKQPASADDILRERYAFALDKIHILEDSIQLYKKLIEQNDKHN